MPDRGGGINLAAITIAAKASISQAVERHLADHSGRLSLHSDGNVEQIGPHVHSRHRVAVRGGGPLHDAYRHMGSMVPVTEREPFFATNCLGSPLDEQSHYRPSGLGRFRNPILLRPRRRQDTRPVMSAQHP